MADKSQFGPELTDAEIDALVDNTKPGNIMEFLIKQLFNSGLLDKKMIITNAARSATLVIYHFISRTPS